MKAYCLLNHELTERQIEELEKSYGCSSIIYPDEALKKAWSQIPAEKELDLNLIKRVTRWLSGHADNDVIIVQGEFGTTFEIVDYALKTKMLPLHAVTERVEKEWKEGEKVFRQYIFEHVCFRKYQYYMEESA